MITEGSLLLLLLLLSTHAYTHTHTHARTHASHNAYTHTRTHAYTWQDKLDWMREQIEMRTRGLQWVEYRPAWSCSTDDNIGTVEELTGQLKELIEVEKERRAADVLPDVAPAPIFKRKIFKALGAPTEQARAIAAQHTEMTGEQLLEAGMRARVRLEAAGEIDRVADRQTDKPPPLDSLVGKKIEVRWRYWSKDSTGKKSATNIWCVGEVVEVADGKTTKRSPRCKSTLPWGAVRMKFEADAAYDEPAHEVWSVLKPGDWRKEVHLGWRYAPCELEKQPLSNGKKPRKE